MTEYIEETKKVLGAVITAPKLGDKLLSRPPFRFLHDVVMSFEKETNFPSGLYTGDMLDSAKVTDKDSKLEFLRLLIAAIEAATGKTCDAKPQKIVSGHEPEHTNQMLQLLASCAGLSAEKKAAAVAKARGGEVAAAPPAPEKKPDKKEEREERRPKREEREERKPSKNEREGKEDRRGRDKSAEKPSSEKAEDERRHRRDEERRERREEKRRDKSDDEPRHRRQEESRASIDEQRGSTFAGSSGGGAGHPVTAGKPPPRTKPTHEVMSAHNTADVAPVPGVIAEAKRGADAATEDHAAGGEEDWMKVAERYEQKPNAPTAGVAGDVEVKGRLGQQALRAKREQEEAAKVAQAQAAAGGVSGGGIIISNGRGAVRGGHGASGAVMSDNDLEKLKEKLQLLTKASNPLGKFLEATHDDIDSMTRELETWRSEARNQAMAAADARRQTRESLQEIQTQLQSMEDAISDQILKTNSLRQTILANDTAMEDMIMMVVGPDAGR